MIVSQKGAESFKISLVEWWQPPGKSIHHRQRHSPTYPTVGGIVEVGIGMCTLMRPSSRSWLCGFILKELVWIFFSFFLRMVLVSQGTPLVSQVDLVSQGTPLSLPSGLPVGSLCAVHSAFSGSACYALFTLVWRIQGAIPATLTAVGVIRITV